MDSKSISIIGAGWFGLPLAEYLVKTGMQVRASTTSNEKMDILKQKKIQPYLLKLNPIAEHFDPELFNSDLLLINIPPRNTQTDNEFHYKQLIWIKNQFTKSRTQKVIFISSTAVYPNLNREVFEEDASPDTISRGGVRLLACEELFKGLPNKSYLILRFGGLIGNERHPIKYLSGKEIKGSSNLVNMVHLDDCVQVTARLIEEEIKNETLNVVSDHLNSKEAFYISAAKEYKLEPPVFVNESEAFKKVSNKRLKSILDYNFKYNY